jgi:hypothetical protein
MLVQRRADALRLIRQHDHALLAGALAFSWRQGGGRALPWVTALATALHDVVWREQDERPLLDPTSGAPHDFTTFPAPDKRRFVELGVERLAQVDPETAALVGDHHRTLAEGGPVAPDSPLAWLRFFDNLSLWICLTPPGSVPEGRPGWLRSATASPPTGALALGWDGDERVRLTPFPFGAPLSVAVPYRDLPSRRYATQAELSEAWESSPVKSWALQLAPG